MEIKFEKVETKLTESVFGDSTEFNINSDVIVPDSKPDVSKILAVHAHLLCLKKRLEENKIFFDGNVKINVLYLTDESEEKIFSITTQLNLAASQNAKNVKPTDILFCEGYIKNLEYSLLNSRKINVKINVEISSKVITEINLETISGSNSDSVQLKTRTINALKQTPEITKEFTENLYIEIPSSKSEAHELLNVGLNIFSHKISYLEGKINLEGLIKANILYLAENSENSLQDIHDEINFEKTFDYDLAHDNFEVEAEYIINNISYKISEDNDGERRVIEIEASICAIFKLFETVKITITKDVYSIKEELKLEKFPVLIEEPLDTVVSDFVQKETISIQKNLPNAASIYDYDAKAQISNVKYENDKIIVEGKFTAGIFYLSNDHENPIIKLKHDTNFAHEINYDTLEKNVLFDANIEIKDISCSTSKGKKIDLKYDVNVLIRLIKTESVENVTAVEVLENVDIKKRPNVIIYFVQKDDSLWKIAKKYKKTIDEVISNNSLETDKLNIGQKLII